MGWYNLYELERSRWIADFATATTLLKTPQACSMLAYGSYKYSSSQSQSAWGMHLNQPGTVDTVEFV